MRRPAHDRGAGRADRNSGRQPAEGVRHTARPALGMVHLEGVPQGIAEEDSKENFGSVLCQEIGGQGGLEQGRWIEVGCRWQIKCMIIPPVVITQQFV